MGSGDGRARGFSLLEVMGVFLLLGMGLLGLLALQARAAWAVGRARTRLGGLTLAASTLEAALGEARSLRAGTQDPPFGAEDIRTWTRPVPGPDSKLGEGRPFYQVRVTREPVGPGLARVVVRVSWRDGGAGDGTFPRVVALTRLVRF